MKRRAFLGLLPAALILPELLIPKRTFFLPPAGGWTHPMLALLGSHDEESYNFGPPMDPMTAMEVLARHAQWVESKRIDWHTVVREFALDCGVPMEHLR